MVKVIFSREQRLHKLSDHHQRRIAGIVVDIFQTDVHSMFVVVRQDHNVHAGRAQRRFQKLKMDRRHLGSQDRVIFQHIFGKKDSAVGGRLNLRPDSLARAVIHGGQQGADADARGAEVVHLINFQYRINFSGSV